MEQTCLVVPVGGNGFTLDSIGATSIIKKTEPSIVVPSQYDIAGMDYEVPAQQIEEFIKICIDNCRGAQLKV